MAGLGLMLFGACRPDGESAATQRLARARSVQADPFEPRQTPIPRSPTPSPAPDPTLLSSSAPFQNPADSDPDPYLESSAPTPSEDVSPLPRFEDGQTSFFLILEPEPDAPEAPAADDRTIHDLLNERELLRAQMAELDRQAAQIARLPLPTAPAPEQTRPTLGQRFQGTVRELDFSTADPKDAKQVMARRGMRQTRAVVPPGISQDFLSGAIGLGGQKFSARTSNQAELSQVLVISPASLQLLARLEREEIQRRGMDPSQTLVRRVVFGIRGQGETADLGVIQMEAEQVR